MIFILFMGITGTNYPINCAEFFCDLFSYISSYPKAENKGCNFPQPQIEILKTPIVWT